MVLSLPPAAARAILADWRFWARPKQLPPGSLGAADPRADWNFWLCLAGRGWGKTLVGAHFSIDKARSLPGSHGALVAPTADDARAVMLSSGREQVPGASGILAISPHDFKPIYEPSKRLVTWPNGSVATVYSAEEPERLRGPQHHWGWCDEVAAWARHGDAFDQFLFGLRLGDLPQACLTTTPRPIPIVRNLLANPLCVVTRGRTAENAANLSPVFLSTVVWKYKGTRLGRQELEGEVLADVEGALWTIGTIDASRRDRAPDLSRIVVAIDPAVSIEEGSDETGIIVAGVGLCRCRGEPELHGFVLDDLSDKRSPLDWARVAIDAYRAQGADRIVAEVNNGGDLVEANLRTVDRTVAFTAVHASRGKRTRAEPIAALYEQGKVHHVGSFPKLEDQMTRWEPLGGQRSPDHMDALVWALSELMLQAEETTADMYLRTKW